MNIIKAILRYGPRPSQRAGRSRGSFPPRLATFVWRMTGWPQLYLCGLASIIAVLNFVPIELQRRLVDDAILKREVGVLLWLGGAYLAVVLLHAALKYVLMVVQSWLGESAVKHARDDLLKAAAAREDVSQTESGRTVTVVGSEIDQLGGFVGEAISQACVNFAFLLVIAAYMAYVEPWIALYSCAFLVPQALLTPYLQEKLNLLVNRHLGLVRRLGVQVTGDSRSEDDAGVAKAQTTAYAIFRNRVRFYVLKYGLKSVLNVVNALGPLTMLLVGGWMVIRGETTLGTVLAFVSGFERLSQPLRELVTFYRVAQQTRVQYARIAAWVDAAEAQSGGSGRDGEGDGRVPAADPVGGRGQG